MIYPAPNHKNNVFRVSIKGNFSDTKDSFYCFSDEQAVHITFRKRPDGVILEEVRELVIMDEIDQFFPMQDADLTYKSNYKSVTGYRGFVRSLPKFEDHKHFLQKYIRKTYYDRPWILDEDTPF